MTNNCHDRHIGNGTVVLNLKNKTTLGSDKMNLLMVSAKNAKKADCFCGDHFNN